MLCSIRSSKEGRTLDAERSIMRGTGEGLLEFCDRMGERGDMNASTARAFRSSLKKILAIESDNADSIDIRAVEIDDLLDRFAKLNRADYSDGSIATYRSRFRLGVAMYLAWLDGDPNWKKAGRPVGQQTGSQNSSTSSARKPTRRRPSQPPDGNKAPPAADQAASGAATKEDDGPPAGVRLITYDVPLRPDLIVRVTLPVDLTVGDAERLAAFVRSLAFSGRNASEPETGRGEGVG